MAAVREKGRVRCPAKVNLSLLVGPSRADGYHNLCTVFAPVTLFDELAYDLTVDTEGLGCAVEVDCPGVDCESNLVTRALEAVCDEAGCRLSGRVVLSKGIPLAAGLGGGSSDAARALRLVADLLERAGVSRLDTARLRDIAAHLGADVPFFLDPRPALAHGIGDELEMLDLPPIPLVLVFPEARLSTAEVYRTFDGVAAEEDQEAYLARCRRADDSWQSLSAAWASGELDREDVCGRVAGLLHNDLEPAAFHLLPELPELKLQLEDKGVLGTLVSGSGPTIFGVAASPDEAAAVVRGLDREGVEARYVVAGAEE